jgi:hypothetical protein
LHAIRAIPSIASGRPRARRHIVHLPRLAPTEGIQPSIIKDIGCVIRSLPERRAMAIVLVEQYLDFAAELADRDLVMEAARSSRAVWAGHRRGRRAQAGVDLIGRAAQCTRRS